MAINAGLAWISFYAIGIGASIMLMPHIGRFIE